MTKYHLICLTALIFLVCMTTGSPTKNYEDAIPKRCSCPVGDDINPVCGNDGVTYPNLMTLQCVDKCVTYNVNYIHQGPCRT